MSNKEDLGEMVSTEISSNKIAFGAVIDQLTIAKHDLKIYTTKNGLPWEQKDTKFLEDCFLHESIETVVSYAESKLCTIICVEDETVKWSGGPTEAGNLFS